MRTAGCVDAGREGCPCALAAWAHCPVCGQLSGGTCEDCSWQGVCIGTLHAQNGAQPPERRRAQRLAVVEKHEYGAQCSVFVLRAPRGFCQRAQTAGAYVFARDCGADSWYDMPVSVLRAEPERERLHLAVCGCGPKSDSLRRAAGELLVRGVYCNALSGLESLRQDAARSVVFARGIAIAPLRNLLDGARYRRWLPGLYLRADLEKIGAALFHDYFSDVPAACVELRSFPRQGICAPEELERLAADRTCNVLALTSPYYADRIARAVGRPVVRPTEGNLCCGEGVCGACTCSDAAGQTVHRCKAGRSWDCLAKF